jgi:hypothetical protein
MLHTFYPKSIDVVAGATFIHNDASNKNHLPHWIYILHHAECGFKISRLTSQVKFQYIIEDSLCKIAIAIIKVIPFTGRNSNITHKGARLSYHNLVSTVSVIVLSPSK